MLERALHLGMQNLHKPTGSNSFRARRSQVRGAVSGRKHSDHGLFNPVGLEASPNESLSIMVTLKIEPIGLAESLPASVGADP